MAKVQSLGGRRIADARICRNACEAAVCATAGTAVDVCNPAVNVAGLPPAILRDSLTKCIASSAKIRSGKGVSTEEADLLSLPEEEPFRWASRDAAITTTTKKHDKTLCLERIGGVQWRYVLKKDQDGRSIFQVEKMHPHQNALGEVLNFVRSHVVPEGFPESVIPCYTPYMQWRCLQYFFGGAMSVFTTRSLLQALGVQGGATSSAIAVNWVVKDGAGRIGKMIFARHGKKFDCHLKQLRFGGDVLMQLGAAVELATVAFPQLFLPLACAANMAKNVAAVTSTSTRAPIYKAFARKENIGDITAKGECIGNIADLLGTSLGILMSKKNFSVLGTFCALSFGYVYSSFREVKAIQLPTLNRHRFGIAVQTFLNTGKVPGLVEANKKERIIIPPWTKERTLELGGRVCDAFLEPQDYQYIESLFQTENYLVTYNPKRQRTYVVLKEKANADDVLRAAFHGQLFLNILNKCSSTEGAYIESCKFISSLYEQFKLNAISEGWVMSESLLNPGDARVSVFPTLPLRELVNFVSNKMSLGSASSVISESQIMEKPLLQLKHGSYKTWK